MPKKNNGGLLADLNLKGLVTLLLTLVTIVGGAAGWDQVMSKYAKADDLQDNTHAIGGLIETQKIAIEEARRAERRRELRDINSRITEIDNQIYELVREYPDEKTMPSGAKGLYHRLKSDKRALNRELDKLRR